MDGTSYSPLGCSPFGVAGGRFNTALNAKVLRILMKVVLRNAAYSRRASSTQSTTIPSPAETCVF